MSVGPLGMIGSSAGSPSRKARASEVNRTQQETASQLRQTQMSEKAEQASGVGQTEQDEQATDRDADGRRPWEIGATRPEERACGAGHGGRRCHAPGQRPDRTHRPPARPQRLTAGRSRRCQRLPVSAGGRRGHEKTAHGPCTKPLRILDCPEAVRRETDRRFDAILPTCKSCGHEIHQDARRGQRLHVRRLFSPSRCPTIRRRWLVRSRTGGSAWGATA